jgi:hypothetical protein
MKEEKENMETKDKEKIKKLKSFLEEYLNLKGVNTNKFMRCFSKIHEDKHPSMSFYRRANICKCFACGKTYNIFELVGQEYGLKTFKEQVEKAEELYNNRGLIKDINVIYSQKGTSAELDYAREKKVEKDLINIHGKKAFYFYECKKRMGNCDYLEKRGISKKVIDYHNIGYDSSFKEGKMKFPIQAIIFPTSKTSYTARNVNEKSNFRYIKVGEASMFNYWELEKNKKVPFYIVEGEIDALSLAEVNRKAISLGSINDINIFVNKLEKDSPENKFYLMLDNDIRGQEAQKELLAALNKIGINCVSTNILENFKDVNEFLMKDKESLIKKLEELEKVENKNIKEKGGTNMSSDVKILDFIKGRIEANTDGINYTTISQDKIRETLGMSKEEFKDGMATLFYSKRIFFHREKEEKINSSDGTVSLVDKKVRLFTDEKAFKDFSNEWTEREKAKEDKNKKAEIAEIKEKDKKVKKLSENAQKIYNKIKEINKEDKVFAKVNDIRKDLDIEFKDMQSALKELTSNKISYARFISYKDKETEEIKNDYVVTNSKKVFAIISEKEAIKEKMFSNDENSISQKVKKKNNEIER